MNRISKIRELHNQELESFCKENQVNYTSMNKLLEAEKTKKLLKRAAQMQPNIDKEIINVIENENR